VCQEIKSTPAGRDTPVLITTAFYRGRKHRDEAQDSYGCDDYLEKPIAEELLLSTCGKFLIDTQEPPLPPDVVPDPTPVPDEQAQKTWETSASTDLVVGMPDLTIQEDQKPSEITALDDLSDDEIQARLDAMIIPVESPAVAAPATSTPGSVVLDAAPVDGPAPSTAVPEPAPEPAKPPSSPSAPAIAREHPNVPVTEPRRPAVQATPSVDVEAEVVSPASVPPATNQAGEIVRPAARAILAPEHAPVRSRLPLWIGIAAGVCIVAGVGILMLFPGEEATDPSIEFAAIASDVSPSTTPGSSTNRTPRVFPTVPILETEAGRAGRETDATDASGLITEGPAAPVAKPPERNAEPSRPAPRPAAETATITVPSTEKPDPNTTEAPSSPAQQETARDERDPQASTAAVATQAAPVLRDRTRDPGEAATERPIVPATKTDESTPSTSDELETADGSPEAEGPVDTKVDRVAPVVPRTRPGDLVNLSEVDRAPVAKDKPMPGYPPAARSTRQEGTVNLRLLVDERGRVEQVEIDSGTKSRQLQRAATQAVKRWVYEPGIKDGVPVKVWITTAVTFKL
jgi:protein TonB